MSAKVHGRVFEFGPFRMDADNWQLTRDDEPIALEPQVFKLLLLLLEQRGGLIAKTALLEQLWPDSHVEERTLTQHVYVLRKALEPHGHQFIQNVPKKGYRFAGEVVIRKPAGAPAESSALPTAAPPVHRRWRWSWLGALPIAALVVWTIDRATPEGTQAVGARLQRLTEHGTAQLTAISPDGRRVAYTRSGPRGESLHVIAADSSEESELIAADGDRYQGMTFSPDGEWLYYVRDFGLSRLRLTTRATEEVLRGVDRPISFSPDGRQFAFIRDDVSRAESSIHIAAADGTSLRLLAVRRKPMFYRAVAWAPKDNLIAASGGYEGHDQMALVVIDIDSALERPLGKPSPHLGEIGWYPGGDSVAAIVRRERAAHRQIVQVAYPSGVETGVTSDLDDYRSLSVSSQGVLSSIQAAQQSNLWMITDGSAPRALTSRSDDRYPAWVNEDAIVYQRRSGGRGQIYRMELPTGATKPLTPMHCDSSAPVVTPDGQWIVYVSSCAGPASLWRMRADGTEPRQLTAGAGDDHPSVSADGAWVYYESYDADGKPIVKKLPLAGGRSETVTTRLSRTPVASHTGDLLACYYWDEHTESPISVALVSTTTGALVGSLPALSPTQRWPFMRWSPDGKFLVTVGRDGDSQNLWGYPVDGGPPRAFTEFSDALDTFSFAWPRLSGRMIVARGHASDDVVLIR
jgi:Tol biopolymer transport system component/DNA-binding winged helix-turn-helix (wHTH) protein